MSTINERVKILRKSNEVNLTLEKFGKRVGVGKSAVSDIESGRNNVTDQMFNSICREFNVNPSWLRDGSGEMFVKKTRDEEIEAFINSVLSDESDSFRKRLISVLSRLDLEGWKVLEKMAMELAAAHDQDPEESQQEYIDSETEAFRRDLEIEVRREEKSPPTDLSDGAGA